MGGGSSHKPVGGGAALTPALPHREREQKQDWKS